MNVSTKILAIALIASMATACHKKDITSETAPTRVKAAVVDTTTVSTGRAYSGTVEESNGAALSFAAPGTIRTFNVNVGDRVTRGQLIATLDGTSLQNAYQISQAALNSAQDTYNRMKQLHDAKALPDMKWVEVQNALKSAQSAAAIARKGLSDANLYASRDGYVSEKMADVGMNAAPGIPVVKIVDINPVKVAISVPENEIASIADNTQAIVTVNALGGKQYVGKLKEKGVTANPLSRSYNVKFEIDNPNGELLPGMICDVAMASTDGRTVKVVPIDAVLLDADNQNFVWLEKDGKAEKRIVTVEGMTGGTQLIVTSGLEAGDSVIVSGQQKVSQGTRVVNIANTK